MIKVLYLMVGLSLKETVDAINVLRNEKIKQLEKRNESLRTYRPNKAIEHGSAEHYQALARHQHEAISQPLIAENNRKLKWLRLIPVFSWGLLTVGLMFVIHYLESNGYGD